VNALAAAAVALALSPAGATALDTSTKLQRSASAVAPRPPRAADDRSRAFRDGCLVPFAALRSPRCVYGRHRSQKTVVLFGDSHALQYFPALLRIAHDRGWRLVHLTKSGCPPAAARLRYQPTYERYNVACVKWRENTIRRIAQERPFLVVAGGATHYHVYDGGWLGRGDSDRVLAAGYVQTLRRLVALAPRVVVIRDSPRPPLDVARCVVRHMDSLRRCAFRRPARLTRPDTISRAVDSVAGVEQIDPLPVLCPQHLCPAVIGDVLVWRNEAHLTATYAATMARWLRRELD
jgi:hypothetical protein